MISFKVQFTRIKIDIKALKLDTAQRRELGEFAIRTIKDRLAAGLDANDRKMAALTKRYQALKQRRTGRAIRDLRLTGEMLDNLSVRSVDEDIVIAFTSASARVKAFRNQQIVNWFGFSPADMRKIAVKWWALQARNIERKLFQRAA